MATDAFSAQIVELVRRMPDEAILELVKNRLGMAPFRALGQQAHGRRAPAARAVEIEPVASKRKRAAPPRAAKAEKPGRPTTLSPDRKEILESVERVVKASNGVSASEVARAASIPQPRAAAALKELKLEKRIFQGGDRRFARYAGDAKVAEAASLAARTLASGPIPVKNPPRSKRAKSAK
jgi:DNA-binding transcriptional ArsR family regulator